MADCLAKPARVSPERSCIYAWAAFLSKPDSHPQASAGLGGVCGASQEHLCLLSLPVDGQPDVQCAREKLILHPRRQQESCTPPRAGPLSSPSLPKHRNSQRQALHPQVVRERSVMSDPLRPRGLQPSRLLCPWDSPGRNTRAGC